VHTRMHCAHSDREPPTQTHTHTGCHSPEAGPTLGVPWDLHIQEAEIRGNFLYSSLGAGFLSSRPDVTNTEL
jgi:hypothetical protein